MNGTAVRRLSELSGMWQHIFFFLSRTAHSLFSRGLQRQKGSPHLEESALKTFDPLNCKHPQLWDMYSLYPSTDPVDSTIPISLWHVHYFLLYWLPRLLWTALASTRVSSIHSQLTGNGRVLFLWQVIFIHSCFFPHEFLLKHHDLQRFHSWVLHIQCSITNPATSVNFPPPDLPGSHSCLPLPVACHLNRHGCVCLIGSLLTLESLGFSVVNFVV